MARKGLSPISAGRGQFVHLSPVTPDSREWLTNRVEWDSTITVVDMFSGAGGMSFGLSCVAGMTVVAAFEKDAIASETHAANLPGPVYTSDVSDIDCFDHFLRESAVRRIDILVGGPPCQGFSRLGKGALRKLALDDGRGVDSRDPRNLLIRHFIRAIRQLKPQVVVIENVPEMLACELCDFLGCVRGAA